MKYFKYAALPVFLFLLNLPIVLFATDPADTRMMTQPAISNNHIAFVYAEDLWVANKDGSNPRRITVDEGYESNPVFSPDAKTIAFNAEYDGNVDLLFLWKEEFLPD
jgi:tricorn protease